MNLNETTLFAAIRKALFSGRMTQPQIDGVRRLIRIANAEGVTDARQVANILAQVYHETGRRMQPVRETFATSDAQMIARLDAARKSGKLRVSKPYWREGWAGRGDIQITHRSNYEKLGKAIGVDLVGNPSLALDPEISGRIAVVGMRDGLFTGKKLSDFFNRSKDDPAGARKIVNGTDKADTIAGYHRHFLAALKAAEKAPPAKAPVQQPTPAPVALSKKAIEGIQAQLRDLGYHEVGLVDGKVGGKTRNAVAIFQEVEVLPITRELDSVTIARLDTAKKRPVDPERASRTLDDLRKGGAQVVVQTDKVKNVSIWGGVAALLATLTDALGSFFGDAWSGLAPFREAFERIPGWAWGLAAVLAAVYLWRRSNSAQLWRLDDERTGRHNGVPIPQDELETQTKREAVP